MSLKKIPHDEFRSMGTACGICSIGKYDKKSHSIPTGCRFRRAWFLPTRQSRSPGIVRVIVHRLFVIAVIHKFQLLTKKKRSKKKNYSSSRLFNLRENKSKGSWLTKRHIINGISKIKIIIIYLSIYKKGKDEANCCKTLYEVFDGL